MALILADRVKETTITSGTGSLTLSGATFGGFQTFADSIGDGNLTYYCIQNFDRFEIGLGTYRASDNSLSRDSVFESSNSDGLINLQGTSVVFSVVPADKLVYKDEGDSVVFPTPFTFKRSDTGDYWQAYSTDITSRVASFYVDESLDPFWKIGFKNSNSDIIEPFYGYISACDGFVELKGNGYSILSIGDGLDEGLKVDHRYQTILDLTKDGGSIRVDTLDINTSQITTIKNTTISSNVLDVEASIGHAADLQTWSVSTDELASINQYGDFETIGNIISPSGRFHAIRFADTTVQTTAALPFASGALIDQNTQNIITNSGYFQTYIDSLDHSATAVSGWARGYIDQTSGNLQFEISQVSSDLSSTSGYFESRVDSADSEILANSGYFESRVDSADSEILANSGYFESKISDSNSSLTTTSGYFESRVDFADSEILANSGYFESRANNTDNNLNTVSGLLTPSGESFDFTSNILTYNNSYGGSFTADLSSLSTFDTSGVSLGYSNGILTYTNNAGGSFGVDISSISGDVYALIVSGAPETLDTLNEIAAALNDDENIANTLTNLITTSSGNLQSNINDNTSNITANSGYFESRANSTDINLDTVSGLLYDHWTVSDGNNSENIYAGETVSFSGVGGTFVSYDSATNIVSISGASDPTGVVSGISFFGDDGILTGNDTLVYDGSNVSVTGNITASGKRVITSDDIYHIEQITQAEYDAITPDSATFYIITDAPSVSGYLEGQDTAISGYFESVTDQLNLDIITVSGLTPTGTPSGMTFFANDASLTGNSTLIYDGENISLDGTIFSSGERIITSDEIFHIKQLTQAEYDAITPDSATFYIITDASEDAAISGYFEARVDQADSDIATVSGLLASVNPTGTPSGVSFFDDSGSLSGNNTFTYDGVDVTLGGNIIASGKRVITSDEIYHIKQLTQAEYDAITPDAATFYIITDPDIEGPVVQPIRTVNVDTTILTTDYTIHATAGLNLTLPSAVGNGGIVYNIKNISAGAVTVSGVGGQTIDGQTSFSLSTQYQSITLQSTNSNWIIL